MTIQHSEQSVRQSAEARFARAAKLLHCHTREDRRKTLLTLAIVLLIITALLFALHRPA